MTINAAVIPQLEQQLGDLARQLDADQLHWASGYLAGLAAAGRQNEALVSDSNDRPVFTLWYGSETGNGRGIAQRLAREAESRGFQVELFSTADITPRSIAKLTTLVLVMSTHGEGDPPEEAQALHRFLMSDRAPQLEDLSFAVFALGDSSYPDFCQTGREFDERLAELGARCLLDRVDVDVDFEAEEDQWRSELLGHLERELAPASTSTTMATLQLVKGESQPVHDRRNPFLAEVLEVSPLTVSPSTSSTHHVELLLEDSGLSWMPGDSLGLWPQNDSRLVEEIIEGGKLNAEAEVVRGDETLSVRDWLSQRLELTQLTRPFIEAWAEISGSQNLRALLEDRDALQQYVANRQVADVLVEFPAQCDAETLIGALRGIAPRLYSIASSPLVHPDEVHLTVKQVGELMASGQLRAGVASWQLTERVEPGVQLPVYLEANSRFRLPEDPSTPILMIGPGTGVAPFRAFVQHRQAQGASGKNWLFFGHRNRRTDFLYQLEWQRFQREGALHRLSVAFSRDQAARIYVQHRLREQGREVYDWLEQGGHVYVCGDGQAMAADVHRALIDVVAEQGGHSEAQAVDYLDRLSEQQRYQKDVY
ncbi:MAG: assimilatory sulfite reductase (NADPH) flavoprotein subunit [Pseudomonadota bacterium]